MRRCAAGLLVCLALLAWAAPAFGSFADEVESLLQSLDEQLEGYRSQLHSAGEEELAKRHAEIQAQLDREWEECYAQLEEEGTAYAAWLQDEYGSRLLRLQLELLLVNLGPEERDAKVQAAAALQEDMDRLRAEKEEELRERLAAFELLLDERFAELSGEASDEIEARLAEEYLAYKDDLLWAFEHTLRNSYAKR